MPNPELPLLSHPRRTQGIVSLLGFTRLDERILEQAMGCCTADATEWMACDEVENGEPILRFYVEDRGTAGSDVPAEELHGKLKELDACYRDLDNLLDLRPTRVTSLAPGTFARCREIRNGTTAQTTEPASRVNPDSGFVDILLALSRRPGKKPGGEGGTC